MEVAKPSFGPGLSVLTSVQTLAPAASPWMTAAWHSSFTETSY